MNHPPENDIQRVVVDRELCIGAASCVALAPEVFELDGENKAAAKSAAKAADEQILNAAKSCPVAAIFLYDRDNRRVYPEPQ